MKKPATAATWSSAPGCAWPATSSSTPSRPRATDKQREAVEQKVKDALLSGNSILSKEFRFLPLESASEEEAVSLVERHIVSPEFISDRRGKAGAHLRGREHLHHD